MTDGIKTQRAVFMVKQLGSDIPVVKVLSYKGDIFILVDLIRQVFESPDDLYLQVEPYKELQTYF